MSKKHIWSSHEDQILLRLKSAGDVRKWTHIARTMTQQFGCPPLNGKQCRDRYVNQLQTANSSADWTHQEDLLLVTFLREHGRKWSLISRSLQERSENSVKNRFYSRVRKTVRDINRLIKKKMSEEFSLVGDEMVNKLLAKSCHQTEQSRYSCKQQVAQALQLVEFLFWGLSPEEISGSQNDRIFQHLKAMQKLVPFEKRVKREEEFRGEECSLSKNAPTEIKTECLTGSVPAYIYFWMPHW